MSGPTISIVFHRGFAACTSLLGVVLSQSVCAQLAGAETEKTLASPNGRYLVQFSKPVNPDYQDKVWGKIMVTDLQTKQARIAKLTRERRGKEINFGCFDVLNDPDKAWSPDGLYLAYKCLDCTEEPALTESGLVCSGNSVCILGVRSLPRGYVERSMHRYEWGGWVANRAHTLLQNSPDTGRAIHKTPVRRSW